MYCLHEVGQQLSVHLWEASVSGALTVYEMSRKSCLIAQGKWILQSYYWILFFAGLMGNTNYRNPVRDEITALELVNHAIKKYLWRASENAFKVSTS